MGRIKYLLAWVVIISCSNSTDPYLDLMMLEQKGYKEIVSEEEQFTFKIKSEGIFKADFKGSIRFIGADRTAMEAKGTFGGQKMKLSWETLDDSLKLVANDKMKMVANSDSLNLAIWTGMVRMGLLHNIARLTQLAPPDHMNGNAREWVRYDSVKAISNDEFDFSIFVQNQYSGDANVVFDRKKSFPKKRVQVVNFPQGEMRVTEEFSIK